MTPPSAQGKAYFLSDPTLRPSVEVGLEPADRLQVCLDRLLGTRPDAIERACEAAFLSPQARSRLWLQHRRAVLAHRELPSLRADGLREIYTVITGDSELLGPSIGRGTGRASEAQVQNDWANALANALGRRLLTQYAEGDYAERSISRSGRAEKLQTQYITALDGAADVPALDPESVDYTERATTHEVTWSYDVIQRGVIATISRRTIVNDDIGLVTRWVDGLARAARRTLARVIWDLWNTNALYGGDGLAWFHADHANVQSTALSETEVIAAVRKLLEQTEPGTGEKMGTRLRPGSLWLDLPHALWDAGIKLNQTTGSALYHLFGAQNEYVNVNPLLSDANDFGVHRDAAEVESIRVNFLQGQEVPELFLADVKNAGQMFIGDRLAYKLRHEYGVAVAEYRGAVKAVVA